MNSTFKLIAVFAGVLLSTTSLALDKVRLGWQIPWALQGQLVQVLKHTDIAKKNNLEIEFIGRTYGPLLNELAMAGSVDVILTADQPAAILFSKDKGWKAMARLMYNRTSTYVPPKSPITKLKDLMGKTIGVPMGAAAERITSASLTREGINASDDVKWTNVDIREHILLAKKHRDEKAFGNLDALSGFDPTPAILEAQGLVRSIDVGKVVSLIVASEEIHQNTKLVEQLRQAFAEAYKYFRDHKEQADKWFMSEALLPDNSSAACRLAEELEPNMKNDGQISLSLSSSDIEIISEAANFVSGKIGRKINVRDYIIPSAIGE